MAEEKVEQEEKKSKALLFIVIGAVVFLVIIIILVAFLLIGSGGEKHSDASQQSEAQQAQQKQPAISSKDANLLNIGPLYAINPSFVVNLVTQNGRRYLKTSITLELSNPKLEVEIDQKSNCCERHYH